MLEVHLTYLAVLLILIMSVCDKSHCAAHDDSYEKYEIYPKVENQQFYCDQVSYISVKKERWLQVVFYNMSSYWEGVRTFERVTTYLEKTCQTIERELCTNMTCETIDGELCTNMTQQLTLDLNELQLSNELLLTQRVSRREPRNETDVLANFTDAVLDEQLAEKYIYAIQQNISSVINFSENLTSYIESCYLKNLFNRTELIVAEKQETINKHLKTLENILHKPQQEINTTNILQELSATVLTASNLSQSLNTAQDILFDTLNSTHYGQLSINLHPRGQFYQAYNTLYINSGCKFVTRMRYQSPFLYYVSSSTTKARFTEQYFIFETTFRLPVNVKHTLYKINPLTQQTENTRNVPPFEYIITDEFRKSFISMTSEELSLCKQTNVSSVSLLKYSALICDWKEPFHDLKGEVNFCVVRYPTNRFARYSERCIRDYNDTINKKTNGSGAARNMNNIKDRYKYNRPRIVPSSMKHVAIAGGSLGALLLGLYLVWLRRRQNVLVAADAISLATKFFSGTNGTSLKTYSHSSH